MDEGTPAKLVREEEPKVGSFGDGLKREREKRGITLDDVSVSTKIGVRMLRALEEEKFEQLPGGIFNKGFVRAYARHLGIDEEQTIADYLEAAGETAPKPAEAAVEAPAPTPPEDGEDSSAARMPWGVLAILLLVTALALSVWSYYTRQVNSRPREAPAAAPAQPQTPSSTPASSGSGSSSSPGSAPAMPAAAGRVTPPAPPQMNSRVQIARRSGNTASASSAGSAVKNSSLVSPDSKTTGNPAKPTATPASGFVVLIEAEDNSWVSIAADGKTILEGTLIAPAVKSVRAQNQIVVKAGNAGGLDFSFNGKKLPSQGDPGEVKSLTFGVNGLEGPVSKPRN